MTNSPALPGSKAKLQSVAEQQMPTSSKLTHCALLPLSSTLVEASLKPRGVAGALPSQGKTFNPREASKAATAPGVRVGEIP
jgi:hypothetical protein